MLLQAWGCHPGADLPGRARRAAGDEEPPAARQPHGAAGHQGQLPDRLDLRHRCVGLRPLPSPGSLSCGLSLLWGLGGRSLPGGSCHPACPFLRLEDLAARVPACSVLPTTPGSWHIFRVVLSAAARNALVVLFAGLVAYCFQLRGSQPLTLTGSIPQGLPPCRLPPFSKAEPNGTVPFGTMVEVGARLAGRCWPPQGCFLSPQHPCKYLSAPGKGQPLHLHSPRRGLQCRSNPVPLLQRSLSSPPGHGSRAGCGPAHGPGGDHCDCQGFRYSSCNSPGGRGGDARGWRGWGHCSSHGGSGGVGQEGPCDGHSQGWGRS